MTIEVETATVRAAETPVLDLVLLELEAPAIARQARPGQFVMVRCGDGLDPFLGRPFSIAYVAFENGAAARVTLLVEPSGSGSMWLSRRRPGDAVTLIGPLGHPLLVVTGVRHLLLLAEGTHIAPLLFFAQQATAGGLALTLIQCASGGMPVFPSERLPPEVEVILEADAAGAGAQQALSGYVGWADQILVAGEEPLLRRVAGELKRTVSRKPATALIRAPVPCGTGLCGACGIETRRRGFKLYCREGPAFDLRELY
ncbi:MAG: iron-sulfur cluster-binding protein [Dehalococcoidia bacterium]